MGRWHCAAVAAAVFVVGAAAVAVAEGGVRSDEESAPWPLEADDECAAEGSGGSAERCALNALQLRASKAKAQEANAESSADAASRGTGTYDLRAWGPPFNAMGYKGLAWPTMTVRGLQPIHAFAIGDWGGMDGAFDPDEPGRSRIIAYKGGHTPGPHVFPRDRWDKSHRTRICDHGDLVTCFETSGTSCNATCGFVPGVDDKAQLLVADAFKARAALADPAFVLNVGDNFYWGGIEKTCGTPMGVISMPAQHQFDSIFEGVYSGPGLTGKPWLSVLGNHDWGGRVFNNGWDQQVAYTWASSRWVMPAPYFSQHVNFPDQGFDVDIYMLDSNFLDALDLDKDPEHNICGGMHNKPDNTCASAGGPPSLLECKGWFQSFWREQQVWLEQQLAASRATWQIVVTHFPCGHEARWYTKLRKQYGLDLLVTGHRHDQELHANSPRLGGLSCIVTGGGGGITSEASPGLDKSQWYGEGQYGFYDLIISRTQIRIDSINYDGKVVRTATIRPSR